MREKTLLQITCLSLLPGIILSINGCGGGAGQPKSGGGGTGGQPTVTSIAVGVSDVNVGQNLQVTATAIYSDGSKSVVTPQSWSSSNPTIASISSSGLAAALAHGQSTIGATYSGVSGSAVLTVHGGTLSVNLTGPVTGIVGVSNNGFTANVSATQTLQVPPGTFTAVGAQATDSTSRYFASTPSQTVTVQDGGTASVTFDYSTIIPNTTKVLDAAGLASLVVADDQSSITFSSASALAGTLNPGDILAIAPSAGAPSGLLLGIISAMPGANSITAMVRTVGLADAIEQATVQYSQVLGPDSLTPESQKMLAPRRSLKAKAADAGVCNGQANTIQFPYSVVLASDSSGSVSLDGEADLCETIQVNINISYFTLQSFSATTTSGIHTSISLTDSMTTGFSQTKNITTFKGKTIFLLIGDVPIGLTPSITPFVGASGSADATVSTGVTTDTTATLGVSYANGTWNPVDTTVSPTAVAATTSADANATLKGWAGLTAGVSINQRLVPGTRATVSLSGDGYLQLTAGLNRNPCWSLDGGIEGSLGVTSKVLGIKLPDYSSDTVNLYSTNIDAAKGPCYTVTVTPAASNIDVGQSVQLTAQETDSLGNTVDASFTWDSSDPTVATVDSDGNVTAVSPGSATITATDPETTVSGKASVVVGGAAPSFFMVGKWAGTVTYVEAGAGGVTTNYTDVGVSLSQTASTFGGTLSGLTEGDIPVTYSVNGQLAGPNISFTISSTDETSTEDAIGTISASGLQVDGNGGTAGDGSSGSIIWDGNLKITGTAMLAPGNTSPDDVTWTGNILTDGQHLTGSATASNGDTVTWLLTRQP